MFSVLDSDELLEARNDSFDDDWIRAAEAVQDAWEELADARRDAATIDAVRMAAFKRAFEASGGHHELAATVSDDFEMICKRAVLGIESSFITALEQAYDAQQIPHSTPA